jgi:hypothetical protein
MLFFAGFFHYQWALAVAGLYCFLTLVSRYFLRDAYAKQYLPEYGRTLGGILLIGLVLVVSVPLEALLRILALQQMGSASGSNLLFRMGISGDDIHNGGLLGALQFLGGNRITLCLADYGSGFLTSSLTDGITLYNCFLSIGGMLLLSLFSIVGLIILVKRSVPAKWIVFCQFHDEMEILQGYLESSPAVYKVSQYHGGLNDSQKDEVIKNTKGPIEEAHEILLLQLQSGGVGLNLQHFTKVIFMSPWWTSALMDQAVGRAVRMGQKETVEVTLLILKEEETMNIDEKMLDKADEKRGMLEQVFLHASRGLELEDPC